MATAIATRTDAQIQRDVLDEMKWEARVQPSEISVAVKDGLVTLTGWVDSYTKRWEAEEAAHRVRGVKAVANDIEVRLPGAAEGTDADIAAAASRALESPHVARLDRRQREALLFPHVMRSVRHSERLRERAGALLAAVT